MSHSETMKRLQAMKKAIDAGTFTSPNGVRNKARIIMEDEPTILCGNPEDVHKQFIVLTESVVSEVFDYYDEADDFSRTLNPQLAMGVYELLPDNKLKALRICGGHNSHREMLKIHKEFTLISE